MENVQQMKFLALVIYGVLFTAFTIVVGKALRSRGWLFLSSTYEQRPAVATSVQFLLSLGFYLTCASLLLWNLGVDPSGSLVDSQEVFNHKDVLQSIAIRLGVSIFVVALFHTANILVLSILNQKTGQKRPDEQKG